MPIYEYKCPNCETCDEVLRGMDDKDAPYWCGWCGYDMERVVSPTPGKVINPAVPKRVK